MIVVVERLAEPTSNLWTEIHDEVQRVLETLDEQVRSRVKALQVRPGRTYGRSFYLFTYRTFSRTDVAEVDPVVVGLTFAPSDTPGEGQVVVVADISGECTGDGIEALARRTIPASRDELFRGAHEMAHEMSCRSGSIVEALLDVSRGS